MINFYSSSKHNQSGFTLVELAVTFVLIGLFVGMVIKGTELIQNTKFKKSLAHVNAITAAVRTFQQKYDALPGDMPNAINKIPGCDSSCNGGNGDRRIGVHNDRGLSDQTGIGVPMVETSLFWKHLGYADLMSGYDPNADMATPEIEMTHPKAPAGGFFAVYNNGNRHGISIKLAPGNTAGFLTPLDAMEFDAQVDREPNPSRGILRANGGPGCDMTTQAYAVNDNNDYCYVLFDLDF